ncbi:MAG: MBOAT family protein [Ruminococcaceae bacterium]|nr:MBOAT family protein [Oscillospiraceae bacterium]
MTFNSFEFLIFYPIVLTAFFLLPHKFRWIMLLAASYIFYMWFSAPLFFLILFTTVVSWLCSVIIERTDDMKKKRLCLILTLITSLGVLVFFKYYNFLVGSVMSLGSLFGAMPDLTIRNLILPVGISFYTFQTLSYAIDVYRGDIKTEPHFGYYALFVSFFPQLVAGPIERPDNLLPQLHAEHRWDNADALAGAKRMLAGFFKKIVVADLLASHVNAVYNAPETATAVGVVVASCMFAVQIYCDFSGYTDIAIGCARIMGIHLMQNFDRPYQARSIKEFWSRWHISLSTWFRDYLYIPLGGSRCSSFKRWRNVMIVFLVSGLWHGAAWTFVIWGFLHGSYQIIGGLTLPLRKKLTDKLKIDRDSPGFGIYQRIVTFVLVTFAWIFFRANSAGDLMILLRTLFTGWNVPLSEAFSAMGLTLTGALTSIFSVIAMVMLDRLVTHEEKPLPDGRFISDRVTAMGRGGVYIFAILAAWMLLLAGDGASSFIYFQF